MANRAAMLPKPPRSLGALRESRESVTRELHPRLESRREHEGAPFGAVRSLVPAMSQIHGGVRGFVAQHLTEKRARRIEKKCGDPDFASRGNAAAKRGAKARTHLNRDAPLELRQAPSACPAGQLAAPFRGELIGAGHGGNRSTGATVLREGMPRMGAFFSLQPGHGWACASLHSMSLTPPPHPSCGCYRARSPLGSDGHWQRACR
jgi:hypothetical protein